MSETNKMLATDAWTVRKGLCDLVEKYMSDGVSITRSCCKAGIKRGQYYYWKRFLDKAQGEMK
jgi:hypothetical protein